MRPTIIEEPVASEAPSPSRKRGKLGAIIGILVIMVAVILLVWFFMSERFAENQDGQSAMGSYEADYGSSAGVSSSGDDAGAQSAQADTGAQADADVQADAGVQVDAAAPAVTASGEPFWGIWAEASKSEAEAESYAADWRARGYDAEVVLTTDWSNLNPEPWYCVTLGRYGSESAAESALAAAQSAGSADAYVKYSGAHA